MDTQGGTDKRTETDCSLTDEKQTTGMVAHICKSSTRGEGTVVTKSRPA